MTVERLGTQPYLIELAPGNPRGPAEAIKPGAIAPCAAGRRPGGGAASRGALHFSPGPGNAGSGVAGGPDEDGKPEKN